MAFELNESAKPVSTKGEEISETILDELCTAHSKLNTDSPASSPTIFDSTVIPKLSLYDASAVVPTDGSESLPVPHRQVPESDCPTSPHQPVAGLSTDKHAERSGASPESNPGADNVLKLLHWLRESHALDPENIRKMLSSQRDSLPLSQEALRKIMNSLSESHALDPENIRKMLSSQREPMPLFEEGLRGRGKKTESQLQSTAPKDIVDTCSV